MGKLVCKTKKILKKGGVLILGCIGIGCAAISTYRQFELTAQLTKSVIDKIGKVY